MPIFLVVVEHGMKVSYLGIDDMEQGNWKSRNQERPGKRQCWNPSCLAQCDEEPARCLHSGTARILGLFQQCQNSPLATQIMSTQRLFGIYSPLSLFGRRVETTVSWCIPFKADFRSQCGLCWKVEHENHRDDCLSALADSFSASSKKFQQNTSFGTYET